MALPKNMLLHKNILLGMKKEGFKLTYFKYPAPCLDEDTRNDDPVYKSRLLSELEIVNAVCWPLIESLPGSVSARVEMGLPSRHKGGAALSPEQWRFPTAAQIGRAHV